MVANPAKPSFGQARVREALRSPPVTCRPDTPMDAVAHLMAGHQVNAVVVAGLGGVEPWGVVTDRDVLLVAQDAAARDAGGCATGRLLTIAPNEPLELAVRLMLQHDVSHLMVIDPERTVPVGVLSTLDIAAVLGQSSS